MTEIQKIGLVLGAFSVGDRKFRLTDLGDSVNRSTGNRLREEIVVGGPIRFGDVRLHLCVKTKYDVIAVVGLGDEKLWAQNDDIDTLKKQIRNFAAIGARALNSEQIDLVEFEDLGCAHSTAEGAKIGAYV